MALHNDNNTPKPNAGANPKPEAAQQYTQDVSNTLGYGGREMYTMTSNLGSEFITKLATEMMESYRQLAPDQRPKVSILDRDIITNLAYSALVVHLKHKNAVNYFIILLEATGREPMTADSIMGEINAVSRTSGQVPFIYTTDDAIDEVLHGEVIAALTKEYGENAELRSVDALVVPHVHHETVSIATKLAAIGFNACKVDSIIMSGEMKDFNITAAKTKSPNTMLRFESNMLKQTSVDEVDKPVRTDWVIELNATDMSQARQSLNMQNAKIVLARVGGFIDAIPEEVHVQTQPGMPAVTQVRLHPHLVITSNSVGTPTPGNMLLGVISSLVMTNDNMWLAAVMPSDARRAVRNTGALNLLTNLGNNANGVGDILDLTGKKISADESYALIKRMFTLDPVVSYDVESFGPQTYYTSALAIAAQPGNNPAKNEAAGEIIETANWLTNGHFPKDFPVNEIFVNNGIVVPLGRWSDKTGERDIRDIDVAFIATQTQDPALIYKWVLSGLPKTASGMDPYLAKVDVISKLIPSAVITGKAVRVTFSSKFITTLINAAMAAGLDAKYEPEIKFAETNNISMVGNYMQGAGVHSVSGFARQQAAQGFVYDTNYSQMGYGRF